MTESETENKCKVSFVLEVRKGADFPLAVYVNLKDLKHSCGNIKHLEDLKKTYMKYDKQMNMILSRRVSSLVDELNKSPDNSCITVVEIDASNYDDEELCAICFETLRCGVTVTLPTCLHTFHFNCFDQWYCRNKTCPLCRCPCFPKANVNGGAGLPNSSD
ncbi:Zinc finger, RING-type [Corchorus olitorius]|uniref:RING-type E3 ubiquitin transferase n=1 Tax=Corchorus olitorius TaxID=93759 RepID=A0A1R3H5T2_9ROSI|nr:Zinc finger, RING-type [Corchorus olitorius]